LREADGASTSSALRLAYRPHLWCCGVQLLEQQSLPLLHGEPSGKQAATLTDAAGLGVLCAGAIVLSARSGAVLKAKTAAASSNCNFFMISIL